MDFNIKTWLIGLLLGIIAGLGFSQVFDKDFTDALSSLGSFLGGLAGIGAAVAAFAALKRWHLQHDYNIAHKILEELEVASSELSSMLFETYYAVHDKELDYDYLEARQTEIFIRKQEYERRYKTLILVIPEDSADDKEFIRVMTDLEKGLHGSFNAIINMKKQKSVLVTASVFSIIADTASLLPTLTLSLKRSTIPKFKN
ncbi:MAG: hypothetical protein KYX63_08085 [Alteromonas macleodii]|nr:hypothetical protein [Alteromonas macleodii]